MVKPPQETSRNEVLRDIEAGMGILGYAGI